MSCDAEVRLPWEHHAHDQSVHGYTRADWERTADRLLLAVRPYASPRHGRIDLPGPRPSWSGPLSDGLEGYARTWLLAALRTAGARGEDPHGFLGRYAEGLAAGTSEPAGSPDAWPLIADVPQAIVESASIALGLRLTRPWLWDTLDDATRQRAADWLLPALDAPPVNNNWWFFGLTVAGFLQDAGIETDRARKTIDRALAHVEDWYLGDGWYSDGPNRSFDHYNAWAMHFYPVLHAHLAGDRDLLDRYGPRLHRQLDDYSRMFGADGAPMPFGRSLIYRFAAAAAPWLGALTGHTPLTPGATRRLASGTLRHFLDHGATDRDGLLTLGWHRPYEPMLQTYSGPASPYWASKGFLGLLMPPDHPVWTADEEPLPAETADAVTVLGPTGMLLQSTAADGLVRLHNHGSNHVGDEEDPGYARFAYSTRTGPTHGSAARDNHFALLSDDGEPTARLTADPLGPAASAHTPLPGIRVVSATLAHGRAEVRAHLVTGAPEGTPVRQTGWATGDDGTLTAQLHPVHGYGDGVRELPGGDTMFDETSRLLAVDGATTGPRSLFVALASLTGEADPAPVETLAGIRVQSPHEIHVTWHDGTTAVLRLPEE
ncbi:DUF2264 domain-containing protein [Streptomyces drozdowiczii]|uniref:DUF2264 domain-containing protein n=1 Tax=Streptomyces drozdowiczii TaxID=202862 RepID=A0ABY6Q257_9ACTN|nr:DUF2264 domain-containing protein [Streptomyces drozdowiczii]MCX0245559.1 DUF2264 domain-containing protein [Streptomyces drozdowiczii]UZK58481.1 DUF2264 domain-containing protein [Streptomyces drozdowiczii]